MPSFYASRSNPHLFAGGAETLKDLDDVLDVLEDEFGPETLRHSYSMNGYVFTQHESPHLQAALKLKGKPQDWIVLLRVPSLGEFMWGDAGDLFFVIHKSDLLKGDFSNIYCGLESS